MDKKYPKVSVPKVLSKTIQYQIMMDIFDPNHDVESKKLIFTEFNTNRLIDEQMIYVLGDNYKHNII